MMATEVARDYLCTLDPTWVMVISTVVQSGFIALEVFQNHISTVIKALLDSTCHRSQPSHNFREYVM